VDGKHCDKHSVTKKHEHGESGEHVYKTMDIVNVRVYETNNTKYAYTIDFVLACTQYKWNCINLEMELGWNEYIYQVR